MPEDMEFLAKLVRGTRNTVKNNLIIAERVNPESKTKFYETAYNKLTVSSEIVAKKGGNISDFIDYIYTEVASSEEISEDMLAKFKKFVNHKTIEVIKESRQKIEIAKKILDCLPSPNHTSTQSFTP